MAGRPRPVIRTGPSERTDDGYLPDTGTRQYEELIPLYNVVLLDDDEHTYDYVIEMLQKLFVLTRAQAFQHAVEVDTAGRTAVLTCELPQAEFARDQIHAYGVTPPFITLGCDKLDCSGYCSGHDITREEFINKYVRA